MRLGRALRPRRGFKNELWRKLEAERAVSAPLGNAWRIPRFARVAVPAFSVLLVFGATGAYAYASSDVLPSTPLYGVKIGLEKVEAAVALTPKQKNSALVRRLAHRLAEAEKVSKTAADYEPLVSEINKDFSTAIDADPDIVKSKKVLNLLEKADDKVLNSIEADVTGDPDKFNGVARKLFVNDSRKIADKLRQTRNPKTRRFLSQRLVEREAVLKRIINNLNPADAANASSTTGTPSNVSPRSTPPKLRSSLDRAIRELQRDFDQAVSRNRGSVSSTSDIAN